MLITNETPAISWSVTDNTGGSSWIAGAQLSQLTNGKPRIGVQFTRSIGSANLYLEGVWSVTSVPRVFALLGLGEEWEGESVAVMGRDPVSGNYSVAIETATPVVRLPDGSLAVLLLIDPDLLGSGINGIRIIPLGSGSVYLIGEVVIATAQKWCIRRDWIESVASLTKLNISVTGQPFNVKRNQQRKAAVTIAPVAFTKGFSIAQVHTLQKLQARLSQNQPVLVIPALRAPGLGVGAAVDTDVVYATALFGWCSNLGQISLVDNSNLAQLRLEFTEAPAGRVN